MVLLKSVFVKQKGEKVINEFGKRVKKALIESDKNQNWLIEQVREKTGMYCDTGYLWKIFNTDNIFPDKIVSAINEILELEPEGDADGQRCDILREEPPI